MPPLHHRCRWLGLLALTTACAAQVRPLPVLAPVAVADTASAPASPLPTTEAWQIEEGRRVVEPIARGSRRDADPELHPWVMPVQPRPWRSVASQAKGSVAIGSVTTGFLVNAAEVPETGAHHQFLPRVLDRHTRYTTDEMKALLLCAAERVAKEFPEHKLHLGNLSRLGGGSLPWSVSHHNGRDADVGFYSRDRHGKAASPEFLYHFNAALRSADAPSPLVFDVAANWALVKGLLGCQGAEIQYMFMANWLRGPVLDYARSRKEKPELVAQAAALLHQPKGALPHNDHLHLRIGCSRDDATEGCLDASRAPADAMGRAPSVQARLPAIRQAATAHEPGQRAAAIGLLGLYRDVEALPRLRAALTDPAVEVRLAAVAALSQWRPVGADEAIARALAEEQHAGVATQMLHVLGALTPELLVDRLRDDRVLAGNGFDVPNVALRQVAVAVLGGAGSLGAAHAAVPLLEDADDAVRQAARRALEQLVNRTTAEVLGAGVVAADPARERAAWAAFLQRLPAGASREQVALAGLQRRGIELAQLDRSALPQLAQALALPAPYRDNAARWIGRLVGLRFAVGSGQRATPERFWPGFLVKRRMVAPEAVAQLLALPMATDATLDAGD
jgi:penicillin-insensitive murein endopeptidase